MPAKKYVGWIAGRLKEIAATVASAGAADDGKIVALDATGRLDATVMPVGIGAQTKTVTASEALSAGNLVNIYDNAGTPGVRKADATTEGKEANGFVLGAVSNGASATVYLGGTVTGLTGLTGGARYYLSTTPGGITTTSPSAANNVSQFVGYALSATELSFEEGVPVTIA